MPRHYRYRSRRWIVFLLAGLLIGGLVLTSQKQKNGDNGNAVTITEIAESLGIDLSPAAELFTGLRDYFAEGYGIAPKDDAVPASAPASGAEVHFIDVGQGKSILIKSGGQNCLIDVGEVGNGDMVAGYLKRHGVKTIDLLIGTHPHSDHIGDMAKIIGGFDIGIIILPDIPDELIPTTRTFTSLLMAVMDKNMTITAASPGKKYTLGGGELRILGPVAQYGDINNLSVVSRFDYGSISFLFTGDIESPAEADMSERYAAGRELRANVLDVSHHGSKTSTGQDLLALVRPEIAVISCGLDNGYGHPTREVLERLDDNGVKVFRTDLDGTVVIATDGNTLTIEAAK